MNRDDRPHPVPPVPATGAPMTEAPPTASPGTALPAAPPAAPEPHRRGPRSAPPGVEYHRVLAGEKRRIGRGVLALALLMGGMFLFSTVLSFLAVLIDALTGRIDPMSGGIEFTPLLNAANLLGLALLIPWSMLVQRWLYGVRAATLHSVLSCFRLELFGRTLLIVGPVWVVYMAVLSALSPYPEAAWSFTDLIVMFVTVLLLAPLQSAGEEYGFRGLAFRIAASWGRGPRTALLLGVVVSSLLFATAHFAADPWLNLYYLTFGATLALITWRTGGLEVAIVVHAVNNTLAFLITLITRTDLAAGFDRSAGVGSAIMLVPCAMLVAATVVVWLRTRRTGPARTPLSVPEPVEQYR
ncbi:CPBP family intramembrane glutamic endopeptidase [Nocardiopsis sp. CC223A]|uniref:CPBP family intramembrane glutamic endopeptidase n=1 Tax=Nocardiopsis sp. CC223A TaxID=3044051 RepID=UPI00278BC1A6|nr:type II CAAX endopeptidase family protein [Nocardiopsis sp. CC223A]